MVSRYDKAPFVRIQAPESDCVSGWAEIGERLRAEAHRRQSTRPVLVLECYPGILEDELLAELTPHLRPERIIRASQALRSRLELDALCQPFLREDPVFGYLSPLELPAFFDPDKLAQLAQRVKNASPGLVLVLGTGAQAIVPGDLLVFADLARWEIQQRQRRGAIGNIGADNAKASAAAKYKRAFFIDWRVADRWKKPLLDRCDFLLDTHQLKQPKLVTGQALRQALASVSRQPFRLVPFFDPGPWGGQWMKEVCDLDRSAPTYAWCFDCVPEENSLLLGFGGHRVELPALDLVFRHPRELLGDPVHARFGAEFPIRFDLLDTMGGGHLSFQVHPLTEFIQEKFGIHYTQDESYYLLDAGPDASVYLGLQEGITPRQLQADLEIAQQGGPPFPVERYVNRWPARKHDHFLIPAGTCHCSGRNSLVLEISATPYIFTFKLWDWGRLGLDGKPRPIHLEHGLANLQWDRTTSWVRENLIDQVEPVAHGEGWREERTGLHAREFIETRRHWFTGAVPHHTGGQERGSVHVLNLVEGNEAIVESPDGAFEAYEVHYAETFVVPACVGPYQIRPSAPGQPNESATIRASIRTGISTFNSAV